MKVKLGRPPGSGTIFREKSREPGTHVQCRLSLKGVKALEAARKRLQKIAKWPEPPSTSDVVEWLARGVEATKEIISARR